MDVTDMGRCTIALEYLVALCEWAVVLIQRPPVKMQMWIKEYSADTLAKMQVSRRTLDCFPLQLSWIQEHRDSLLDQTLLRHF